MSLLAGLTTDESIKESKDSVGGGFTAKPSGIYDAVVKVAYITVAASGAKAVNLIADINGTEYRETIYITNKKGQNFYVSEDGTKNYLPGFTTVNDLALLTTGQPLANATTENKVIKIWNKDQAKEVPTEVPCITALHGKPIKLGILEEITFKQVKDANNNYVDTPETRTSNIISKVFHASTGKTVNEYKAKAETAEFIDKWKAKWDGQPNDKTAGKTPKGSASAQRTANATAPKAASSLFA